jgi:hypothetical protein
MTESSGSDQDQMLTLLEKSILEAVSEANADGKKNAAELSEDFERMFLEVRESCKEAMLKDLLASAGEMLSAERIERQGFERRTFERWKPSFDHLEMMWRIAQEVGEANARFSETSEREDEDFTFNALCSIFPRALLIAQEVLCLLRGGFPDGALARWRSLHELTVTAMFLAKRGEDASKEYLLSFHFSARRAAKQLNSYSDRNQIKELSAAELYEIDQRCKEAERILGRNVVSDKDGEWPAITMSHRTFADLEREVGMDHWRPYYKWASTHTHAGHRLADRLLGLSESDETQYLVGASNSGFVDPLQMTAISLANITSTFLLYRPNADRIIIADVLLEISKLMSSIAMENERSTLAEHKRSTGKDN